MTMYTVSLTMEGVDGDTPLEAAAEFFNTILAEDPTDGWFVDVIDDRDGSKTEIMVKLVINATLISDGVVS